MTSAVSDAGAHSNLQRCHWAEHGGTAERSYHDLEWGVPRHDERALFELLTLEGAQAGLSWSLVLSRREGYRRAFEGFEPAAIATWTDEHVEALVQDPRIIRHRGKIASVISNARAVLDLERRRHDARQLLVGLHGRRTTPTAPCPCFGRPRDYRGGRRAQPGPPAARVPIRRPDDLLRLHAGRRSHERPRHELLSLRRPGAMNSAGANDGRPAGRMPRPSSDLVNSPFRFGQDDIASLRSSGMIVPNAIEPLHS